jgi:MOSC domain-containing protein YiiM
MPTYAGKVASQDRVVRTGRLIALAYSPELIKGVGKEPHASAHITKWGIPNDRHYGETRYSHSRRATVANNRPITVLGVEATRSACEKLGIPTDTVPAGGMGENLLTEGLGDLGDLEEGDEIRVLDEAGEPKIVLRVRQQNEPCSNLQIYHRLMTKEMMGKRGVICTVLKEGHVQVGDRVALVR